jgi:Membrane MotB of proton-channel complex MotA/MotB
MDTDEAATAASGRPLGAISTLVSLFLLLLVFFIVLFSISQVHQPRLDAVMTSIDDAFGRLPSGLGLLTRPIPSDADATPEGWVRAVGALVTGFAPLSESPHLAPGGTLLEIDLAPEQIFQTDTGQLQPDAAAILDRLAVLLQRRLPGRHYRLILRAVVPHGATDANLAADRIAGFAAALFAKGCPADALAIGIEPGSSAALRFDFVLVGAAPEAD